MARRRRLALFLDFEPDGRVTACPILDVAEDAEELARCLRGFAWLIIENPSLCARAAGMAA